MFSVETESERGIQKGELKFVTLWKGRTGSFKLDKSKIKGISPGGRSSDGGLEIYARQKCGKESMC